MIFRGPPTGQYWHFHDGAAGEISEAARRERADASLRVARRGPSGGNPPAGAGSGEDLSAFPLHSIDPSFRMKAAIPARPAWFCLRTRPMREEFAAQQLQARVAVEVFAPRIRVQRQQKSGLVRTLVEALFPGYLFAKFNYADQVRHVLSTQGITGLVSIGELPRAVDDMVIEFLKQQLAVVGSRGPAPAIAEGDWVRVVEGAFRNSEGRVVACDPGSDRVRLLLRVLGREVQISLSRSTVMPQKELETKYPAPLLAQPVAAS